MPFLQLVQRNERTRVRDVRILGKQVEHVDVMLVVFHDNPIQNVALRYIMEE